MTDKKEITVRVQRMFPNCDKYKKCCPDSGMEELMAKVKKIHNYEGIIERILDQAKGNVKT